MIRQKNLLMTSFLKQLRNCRRMSKQTLALKIKCFESLVLLLPESLYDLFLAKSKLFAQSDTWVK